MEDIKCYKNILITLHFIVCFQLGAGFAGDDLPRADLTRGGGGGGG